MNPDDFISWFGDITKTDVSSDKKWTDEDELDSLWRAYDDFVQELKIDGYKVMRNSVGRHKIVKE